MMEALPRLYLIFNHCMLSISNIEFMLSTIHPCTIAVNHYIIAFHHIVIAFKHCLIALRDFNHRIIYVNQWAVAFMIAWLQPFKHCLFLFRWHKTDLYCDLCDLPSCRPGCHVSWGRMDL